MKTLGFFCILLVFLTGCSSIKTYTDYDKNADFEQFSGFSFYNDMDTGLDSLDQKRFTSALKDALEKKKFHFAKEDPDFKVNFYGETFEEENRNNIGIGIGTIGSHVSGNVVSGIPLGSRKRVLSLTVEFVDAQTDVLFWQGVAEGKFNREMPPEKREEFFRKMTNKVLKDYPPKL